MTPQRFQELVAAYGADPARWPAEERAAAMALAAGDAEARRIQAREAELDALLDRAPAARAGAGLTARIAGLPRRMRASWVAQAATFLAAAVLGALVGLSTPEERKSDDPWDLVVAAMWEEG